jgi:hypothetical protein
MRPPCKSRAGHSAIRLAIPALAGFILSLTAWAQQPVYRVLELSRFATTSNAFSTEVWSLLPKGTQSVDGVGFRIDGRVEVTGLAAARAGSFSRSRISGIPVGGKVSRLFLLHGTSGDEQPGVPVAQIVLHYANGKERALRLAYGVHVRNSFPERGERPNALADANSKVAWTAARDESDRFAGNHVDSFAPCSTILCPTKRSSAPISFRSSARRRLSGCADLEENGPRPRLGRTPSGRLWRKAQEFADEVYRRQFLVNVVDSASGKPLTNATASLTITDHEFSFYFGEARADEPGRMALDYPPQQTVAYGLLVKAPGYLPVALTDSKLKSPQFEGEFVVRLARGVSVGGIVQSPSGERVPGAEVVLHKVTQDGPRQYTRVDYDSVRTDAKGRWSSTALPTNFSGFNFQVTHPEHRATLYTDSAAEGLATLWRLPLCWPETRR